MQRATEPPRGVKEEEHYWFPLSSYLLLLSSYHLHLPFVTKNTCNTHKQ